MHVHKIRYLLTYSFIFVEKVKMNLEYLIKSLAILYNNYFYKKCLIPEDIRELFNYKDYDFL